MSQPVGVFVTTWVTYYVFLIVLLPAGLLLFVTGLSADAGISAIVNQAQIFTDDLRRIFELYAAAAWLPSLVISAWGYYLE